MTYRPLEFVDDIADPNDGLFQARKSNGIIVSVQEQKKLTFDVNFSKLVARSTQVIVCTLINKKWILRTVSNT